MKSGIVQLQFSQCITKCIVLVGFNRIKTCKHLALCFFKTGECLFGRFGGISDGITDAGVLQFFNTGNNKAHLPGGKLRPRLRFRRKHTDLFNQMVGTGRHQTDFVFRFNRAVNHANEHNDADIVIEPGINNQRLKRSGGIALRSRNTLNDAFENLIDAHAGFRRRFNRVGRIKTDHIFYFFFGFIRISTLQVHLIENRKNFYAELNGGVAVGNGLSLNALCCIND